MKQHDIRRSFALNTQTILDDLLTGISPETVTGAVLFLAPDIDCQAVTSALNDLIPYVGCTMHSTYSHSYSVKVQNQTASMLLFFGDSKQQAGLVNTFKPGTAVFAFSVNDPQIENYVTSHRMLGGIAAENYASDRRAVWTNHLFSTSDTVAMTLPQHPVFIQVGKGWSSLNREEHIITKSIGNQLHELDGKPVRTVYEQYIGIEQLTPSYPLLVVSTGNTVAPLHYERSAQGECLILSRPISEGERVQICFATRTDILHHTHDAALRSFIENEQHPRSFCLCISCTSRAWILSDMEASEFGYLQKFSGPGDVDNLLVYLNGEFQPTATATEFHNHSSVIAAFYSEDSDLISDI